MYTLRSHLLSLLLIILLIPLAHAADLGIGPGKFEFEGMQRGGYAEEQFRVYSQSEDAIYFGIDDFNRTPISEWVTLRAADGSSLELGTTYTIENGVFPFVVEVNVPEDVANGQYKSRLHVYTTTPNTAEGLTTMSISTRVAADLLFTITDQETRRCEAKLFSVASAEKTSPATLTFFYRNWGNVVENPSVDITLWDQSQNKVMKEYSQNVRAFKPTTYANVNVNISTADLSYGQYWLEAVVPGCSQKQMLTFDVLEPGTISSSGSIIDMKHKTKVLEGENVRFAITFRNSGQRAVQAQYLADVLREGQLIDKVESDRLSVAAGAQQEFVVFYTPDKQGKYTLKGRFVYDGKQTFPLESPFIVFGSDAANAYGESSGPSWWMYVIILAIIALGLLIMIKKKKRKHHHYF